MITIERNGGLSSNIVSMLERNRNQNLPIDFLAWNLKTPYQDLEQAVCDLQQRGVVSINAKQEVRLVL